MAKYLIETISVFRHRYVIEAENMEHAMDEVCMNDGEGHLRELSQSHITESITGGREIDDAEYLRVFNEDNDYLRDWTDEQKFSFINEINYDS